MQGSKTVITKTAIVFSLKCHLFPFYKRTFSLFCFSFFKIRLEDAHFPASKAQAGRRHGVRHRLHPWPHKQQQGWRQTYKSALWFTFVQSGRQTSQRERYKMVINRSILLSSQGVAAGLISFEKTNYNCRSRAKGLSDKDMLKKKKDTAVVWPCGHTVPQWCLAALG